MIEAYYSEMDTAAGMSCRMEASGHAGYAPAGQDIVCAGVSTLMQALVYLLAGEENVHSEAQEGPVLAVQADAPCEEWVRGAFELVKAGFVLLAERYPEQVRYKDISKRGEAGMMDLQLFAEGGEGAESAAPALSHAQAQQAVAAGTMKPEAEQKPAVPEHKELTTQESPAQKAPEAAVPPKRMDAGPAAQRAVQRLHARWAAEEAQLRREEPGFSLKEELKNPEMRRLMQMPGMRMKDAYRLANYEATLRRTAQTVEQGVVQRMQQRAARPVENGIRPGAAAAVRPDVAKMTRAQREALERRAMHGAQIEL